MKWRWHRRRKWKEDIEKTNELISMRKKLMTFLLKELFDQTFWAWFTILLESNLIFSLFNIDVFVIYCPSYMINLFRSKKQWNYILFNRYNYKSKTWSFSSKMTHFTCSRLFTLLSSLPLLMLGSTLHLFRGHLPSEQASQSSRWCSTPVNLLCEILGAWDLSS